jgi:hypothetical protein
MNHVEPQTMLARRWRATYDIRLASARLPRSVFAARALDVVRDESDNMK